MDESPGWIYGTAKAILWMLPAIIVTLAFPLDPLLFLGVLVGGPLLAIFSGLYHRSWGVAYVSALIWIALVVCWFVSLYRAAGV